MMQAHQLAELQAQGFTVVKALFSRDTCRRARAAIDATLGAGLTEALDRCTAETLGPNSTSGNYIHTIAHPHPALAVIATQS